MIRRTQSGIEVSQVVVRFYERGMPLKKCVTYVVIPGLRSRSPGHLRQQEAIDLNNNIQQTRGSNTLVAQ